jgi:hypothetical protein
MARKVVQIATSRAHLYALCDDGKIYQLISNEWIPIVAIPQTTPPAKRGVRISVVKRGRR